MIIDHIGIVVPSLSEGIRLWEDLFGYRKESDIVLNTRQRVNVVFLFKQGSVPIKLIEPSEATSVIAAFARRGGGLHHLCFRCEDLGAELRVLRDRGARLLVPPEPGEAFLNHEIAFLSASNIQFELIDTTVKTGSFRQDRL